MKKILIINASLGGASGNTAGFINRLARILTDLGAQVALSSLASGEFPTEDQLKAADGFVFASGTYWDSWSSHMQKLLEDSTHLEGREVLFGKPAACLITMHSVGGKSVLSRLQGVLSTFGLMIPPQSGLVLSAIGQTVLELEESDLHDDIWHPEDLQTIAHNLLSACKLESEWRSWPVDRKDPRRIWFRPSP